MRRLLHLLAVAVLVQACGAGADDSPSAPPPPEAVEPPGPPAVEGFAHQSGADLFGYYLPVSDVQIGDLKLSHLHLGDEAAFADWEQARGQGPTNFAPVLFQFDDLSSPTIANELGGQTPEVIVRVLPTGYGISERMVRFAGTDPTLGEVRYEGQFVQPAFHDRRSGAAPTEPVLRGTLTIGGRIYEGQSFIWFAGD
ncbi:MAG TPA: hypothetical protein PLE81_06780 [Brevundimonas sp.]|jgi:hypothetical protein|uniref:hypothetical protein n=1 Tax=Brevundimonas sp. TaxID=1871086 RepID=UPI002CAE0F9B|nr:hypothetical protein [Brevundimonas sp.]HRH20331.1 hypothetical protein [Brevundimonas sp.]